MAFFRQFPKIQYNTLLDGLTTEITNIYRHVDVNDVLIDDASTYTYYEIQDGERPDIVSSRLYGTPDYYWTFFVANESLKSGMNSWPLEYNQFQEWIEQEYGAYSVMVFAPIQTRVLINGEVKIEHKNYFGGLDLTDVEIVDQNGNSAKISHYDIETLQLWIYDVSHPQFFDEKNRSFTLRYTGSDELEWYKNALDWASRNSPFAYDAFIRFTNLEEEGIELDTFDYYQLFYTRHFRNIIFESRAIIAQAKNAAKYYLDADIEEKSIISGYQAYNLEYELSELEIEPYFRGQLEEFEDTYTSPFVKGNVTDVISDTYTQSFSSGSYSIYRPDPTSIGVSILEYEEEQNFEKRKIRVIRPNVIETFVERYKDLIQS